MKIRPSVMIAAIAAAMPFVSIAAVKPAALFADNMIIQRETQAPVWGSADAGEKVTVTGSWGKSAKTTTGDDGKWMVELKTPEAGGPHAITIQGENSVEIKNVLSGEVWFCSGQSNMDFLMKKLQGYREGRTDPKDIPAADYIKNEIATAKDDLLRQFEVEQNTSPFEPVDTLEGKWIASSPENNSDFSATAYFFGRELRKELNVPVAIIKCAWGGTRVEPWIPAEAYQDDAEMAAYFESSVTDLKGKLEQWDPEKVTGKGRKSKKAADPKTSKQFPSTLFNGMVNPVIPYAIKGAIWYQGNPMRSIIRRDMSTTSVR